MHLSTKLKQLLFRSSSVGNSSPERRWRRHWAVALRQLLTGWTEGVSIAEALHPRIPVAYGPNFSWHTGYGDGIFSWFSFPLTGKCRDGAPIIRRSLLSKSFLTHHLFIIQSQDVTENTVEISYQRSWIYFARFGWVTHVQSLQFPSVSVESYSEFVQAEGGRTKYLVYPNCNTHTLLCY